MLILNFGWNEMLCEHINNNMFVIWLILIINVLKMYVFMIFSFQIRWKLQKIN